MARLELVLGSDWQDNIRYLSELPFRPSDSPINLMEIRDIVDLVVDGTNLTADIEEECIFGIVAQLVEGLASLAAEQQTKVLVEFPVEPYELALVPDGEDLLLSLYSVDRAREVLAHNIPVNAQEFAEVVAQAAESLLTEVLKIHERFSTDPFVRTFSADLSRLRKLPPFEFKPLRHLALTNSSYGVTSSSAGLTLSYEITELSDLARYAGEHVFDQHALLIEGTVQAELAGGQVTLNEHYPVLVTHAILRRCRELLNLIEGGRAGYTCKSQLHHLIFDVKSEGGSWTVRLGRRGNVHELKLQPAQCLDAFLTLCELILAEIRRIAPSIAVNQRFSDLQQDARDLRAWFEDLSQTNKYLERPEEFLEEHAGMQPSPDESGQSLTFSWPFESVRALYPTTKWKFEISRVHFAAVTKTATRLLIPTSEVLVGLDIESGEECWRARQRAGIPLSSYAVSGDLLLLANEAGDVWLSRAEDGQDIGRLQDCHSSLLLDVAHYQKNDVGVVADFHGQLAGFDASSGEGLWEHTTGHGYLTGVVFDGPLICALSSPGVIQALAPLTGELLWKVKLGGVADAGPFVHQGRVFAVSHDPVTKHHAVHAIQPFTGRAAWHLRVEGTLARKPDFVGDWMLLCVERHGRIQLLGANIEAPEPAVDWSIELMSAGIDSPTSVAHFVLDGKSVGVIRTDRGELTCFALETGEIVWRSMPESPGSLLFHNLNPVVVRDSLMTVSETIELRSLADGHVMHTFGDVLEAPEFMCASGNLALIIGEPGRANSPDQMICLTLGHFLAVVAE